MTECTSLAGVRDTTITVSPDQLLTHWSTVLLNRENVNPAIPLARNGNNPLHRMGDLSTGTRHWDCIHIMSVGR